MTIIVLTSSGSLSGGARQAIYLAAGLSRLGHNVHFVCKHGTENHEKALELGLDCTHLPPGLREANRVLRSLMPKDDKVVLHAFHNRGVKLAAYLGTLWRIQGLPVVCVAHRGVTRRPGNPLPYLLPGIRAYLVNSLACAKTLPLFWRRKRCHIVSNSIPAERLTPLRSPADIKKELGIPDEHFVIGDVANFNPQKGAELLLRIYAEARAYLPPSTLLLVGVDTVKLIPLCRELGIEKYCRLVGKTDFVSDYLQIMSLLVFPSRFIESQPNVILEAMCLGVPVIASNIGGIPEILPSDCLFDPWQPLAIRNRIIEMANFDERLALLRKANLARRDIYSLENRLHVVLSHYRAALAENSLHQPLHLLRKRIGFTG